mgnify:CR=1 FL=1
MKKIEKALWFNTGLSIGAVVAAVTALIVQLLR